MLKLYRYTYKKGVFKLDIFDAIQNLNGNYLITEKGKMQNKTIEKDKLDEMVDGANYVMWSLKKDNHLFFLKASLNRKKQMIKHKKNELNEIKEEAKSLRKIIELISN